MNSTNNIEIIREQIKSRLFSAIERRQGSCDNKLITKGFESNTEEFPELVLLNKPTENRPIFWFHSVGGVQPYSVIAKQTERPFYGIETRGFRTNRVPLQGVHAMAAYYIHIIKTVQPYGPYDFGGYSLGGLIAYEVTRQLQELGDEVQTIVMLDTLGPSAMALTKNVPYKTRLLQGANFILATQVLTDINRLKNTLIHQSEINWQKRTGAIVDDLAKLCKARAAYQSHDELKAKIIKNASIQNAYEYDKYKAHPLIIPDGVLCYYFRNKSGLFFGDLKPYYTIPDEIVNVDNIDYWSDWKKYISNFKIFDVNSSNHMVFFNEDHVYQYISKICKEIYINEPLK